MEFDGSDNITARYLYGPGIDQPILIENASGNRYFYHFDRQGSVVALSDGITGNLTEQYAYGPYGESSTVISITGNSFRFTGRRLDDETGLYYYRARYYDPTLGRFLQTDPIGYEDQMNLYAYVYNDPINFLDPLGLGGVAAQQGNGFLDGARNFVNGVVDDVTFGVNAVRNGVAEDYREGGILGAVIGATGGRTNQGFFEQVGENYLSTSLVVGPIADLDKRITAIAVGGAVTRTYGGYSFGQLILRGPAPHLGTYGASARLAAGTTVVNSVLITGAYEFANGVGSAIRSGINRGARVLE